MPESPDFEPVCVLHESKGALICERVAKDAASVRLCLNEHEKSGTNQIVYREFYLTGERDAEGRPIYRGLMPETPDFDQIALTLVESLLLKPDGRVKALAQVAVIEQLRLIWNARGAADLTKLAAYLSRRDEGTLLDGAIISVEAFERVLRGLDR